ncbi:MAG: hypothetical protein IJQ59_02140 [Bacteroidaceae bacterium]|nr:hypothetical protein [Bacteroidaceae bacterium]
MSENSTSLLTLVNRLRLFGERIPQEKVFVHMDNTCYFLGDTIWFSVYSRQTNTDKPSKISRVLYAELWNHDGYLVERKLIEMKAGRGHGNFVLNDTLYGGYYELRAYTRWQLNWGITEKSHTTYAEDWFYNKTMAKEFYRDYDKLYSRVFPVYDKPQEAGAFHHDMTMRPKRRYFKDAGEAPALQLSLFPEGGNLVAGVPCRVAFEAATSEGEACEGALRVKSEKIKIKNDKGEDVESVATVSRGRGVFTLTPEIGHDYEFTFTDKEGRTAKAKLPKAEADGVALCVERQGNEWNIQIQVTGEVAAKPLGLTIMHEGRTQLFQALHEGPSTQILYTPLLEREGQGGESGVNQLTVFDTAGRIYADRLFFVTRPELTQPTLTIQGLKEQYEPFEQVNLQVTAPSLKTPLFEREGAGVSLSVRDVAHQDYTFDTGNIMTEMLLASEIKGFVPQPEYFFEKDDEEHRRALDLLMMTQGWRRFKWQEMAVGGTWEITQPAENPTQVLRGEVYTHEPTLWQDDINPPVCEVPSDIKAFGIRFLMGDKFLYVPTPYAMENTITGKFQESKVFREAIKKATVGDSLSTYMNYMGRGQGEIIETIIAQTYADEHSSQAGSYRMRHDIAASRFTDRGRSLKHDVLVHAEFAQPGNQPIQGELTTDKGHFKIQAPYFKEACLLYLSASDTTRWKKGKRHTWIDMDEQAEAEYYVRLESFYPRFTKPYHFAQTHSRPLPENVRDASRFNPDLFETNMQTFTVRARHGGLRRFDASKPAFVVDAYQAFNDICDAGLSTARYGGRIHFINGIARCYLGDMNTHNAYLLQPRYDGRNVSYSFTSQQIDRYNLLSNLDKVSVYTDFSPRYDDNTRITEDNVENAVVNLQLLPDEGQRTTYRDRRYVLQGFSIADEFYHPDYQRNPPREGQKDYRRTLYWNPDLQLDSTGQTHISFFNNSQKTQICVEANGLAADGTLLYSGEQTNR